MRLEESSIDPTKLYFHGTSGKIEKLKAPSAEKPFFVCSDIDYAYAYSKAGQLNGRTTFTIKQESPGNVYVIAIDDQKTNAFDALKETDVNKLSKRYPKYLIDSLNAKKWSIWSIFSYINSYLHAYYRKGYRDVKTFVADLVELGFKDFFETKLFEEGLEFLTKEYEKEYKKIFAKGRDKWDTLFDLITLFNTHLQELGWNAFINRETVSKVKVEADDKIVTYGAVGLFDKDCLKSGIPIPLDPEDVKEALKNIDAKVKEPTQKLKQFVKSYKEKNGSLNESKNVNAIPYEMKKKFPVGKWMAFPFAKLHGKVRKIVGWYYGGRRDNGKDYYCCWFESPEIEEGKNFKVVGLATYGGYGDNNSPQFDSFDDAKRYLEEKESVNESEKKIDFKQYQIVEFEGDDLDAILPHLKPLIKKSYDKIGGKQGERSLERLRADATLAQVVYDKGKIIAFVLTKKVHPDDEGNKINLVGCDQSWKGKEAMQAIIKHDIQNFTKKVWCECSGAIEHWFKKHGGYPISNQYAPELIGIDRDKMWFHEDGWHYRRFLAAAHGRFVQKMIFGFANDVVMQKTLNTIGYDLIREKIVNVNEDEHNAFDKARDFIASLKKQFDDGEIVEMLPPVKEYLEKAVEITSKSRDAMSLVGQRLLDQMKDVQTGDIR